MKTFLHLPATAVLAVITLAMAGCASVPSSMEQVKPSWLTVVSQTHMDGQSDDLLTAGMGMEPLLRRDAAPGYANPLKPTAAELRRAAIYSRSGSAGGFGQLYGPNIDPVTRIPVADVGVAGEEILAYSSDVGVEHASSSLLLQIPDSFDTSSPCILAVPTTGSAHIYADLLRVGGWGLRRNCAVVYTDKGQANGVHNLEDNTVNLVDGRRTNGVEAGTASHFTAPMNEHARAAFLKEYPHRIAFKHAHSRQNSDAIWGREVVRAVQFAFYALNQRYAAQGKPLTRSNTVVIATGNSNGGGAALLGGEFDKEGWIDGIVAAQPQIQPEASAQVVIQRQGREWRGGGRSLIDYFTEAIIYQPCAVLATPTAWRTDEITFGANRCTSLQEKGLLKSTILTEQAQEARQRLHDMGYEPDSDDQTAVHFLFAPTATANKYANSQGRFGVEEQLCGYSTAAVDDHDKPRAATPAELATIFVTASGGAPAGAIDIINDLDPRGPTRDMVSVSPSTGRQDYNLDGVLCLRSLVTGNSPEALRVQAGIAEGRATAVLNGKPTLILHGREDARVPATFSARPYVGLNSLREAASSGVHYIEITNINHFGTFGEFDAKYVPLAYYEEQALDLMWEHLKNGTPLPPHQLVRTLSRGGEPGKARALEARHLPPIRMNPAMADRITVQAGQVMLPD